MPAPLRAVADLVVSAMSGQEISVSIRLTALAQYLIQLGDYDAINLDGGGSSTFVYDDGGGTRKVSTPGDFLWYRPLPPCWRFGEYTQRGTRLSMNVRISRSTSASLDWYT